MDGERGSGAALRRRERPLALAEKLHHSANKVESDNALRGQEKRAGREEAGLESHSGLRAPTPLPPGTRPEPLDEPLHWFIPGLEALCPDDGGVPSLATPSLADAAGDAVDAVTVEFLVEWALLEPEEQERIRKAERRKRERRKKQEETLNLEVGKRKRKKKRKKKLPRTSSRPHLASSGYKFLPRSRRLFGTNSTHFLRGGGARAVRTWKPGLSSSHWYLAPTCSVPFTPEEHEKIWNFLGDDYADFLDPLYLTVTCSAFAGGVQDYGRFWKMTSRWIPCPAPVGSTPDTCLRQFTEAFTVQTASSRSSTFPSWCRGSFPWSCYSADHSYSPVAVLERDDRCPCCAKSFTCPLCATTCALVCVAHQHGRLHPVVALRLIPMVLFVQKIIEIPQLLVDAVSDVPVVRVVQVPRF